MPTQRLLFRQVGASDAPSAVVRRLRAAIGLGLLSDGEKLPREADLAKELQVSIFSLREALAVLRNDGLIITRPGKNGGSFVRRPKEPLPLANDELTQLSSAELRDLGDWRQMLTCTAALSWMTHGDGGAVLALGRRRRRPSSAIRRAARERDHGRCRFPGCEARRVDLHHVQHWINGGRTDLENLVSLCPYHHKVVHDRGYLVAAPPGGGFAFYRPDGTRLPACPALPEPDGPIGQAHDGAITPDTIIPPWYGERLDLDHAIYVCFANARTEEQKRADQEQAREPAFRPRRWVSDLNDTVN